MQMLLAANESEMVEYQPITAYLASLPPSHIDGEVRHVLLLKWQIHNIEGIAHIESALLMMTTLHETYGMCADPLFVSEWSGFWRQRCPSSCDSVFSGGCERCIKFGCSPSVSLPILAGMTVHMLVCVLVDKKRGQCHSDVLVTDSEGQKQLQELLNRQRIAWQSVQSLLQYNVCLARYLSDIQHWFGSAMSDTVYPTCALVMQGLISVQISRTVVLHEKIAAKQVKIRVEITD